MHNISAKTDVQTSNKFGHSENKTKAKDKACLCLKICMNRLVFSMN